MTNCAKEIIARLKEMFPSRIQMFDCLSWTPDYKVSIYSDDKVDVLYAPYWDYVEVLGVTEEEFDVIFKECGY